MFWGLFLCEHREERLGFERWNGKNTLLKFVVLELHGSVCWS